MHGYWLVLDVVSSALEGGGVGEAMMEAISMENGLIRIVLMEGITVKIVKVLHRPDNPVLVCVL